MAAPGNRSRQLEVAGTGESRDRLMRRRAHLRRMVSRGSPPPGPWRESGRAILAWRRPRPSRDRLPRRPACRSSRDIRIGAARRRLRRKPGGDAPESRRSARPGAKGAAARGASVRHPVVRPFPSLSIARSPSVARTTASRASPRFGGGVDRLPHNSGRSGRRSDDAWPLTKLRVPAHPGRPPAGLA
jgi:hypothetical protein